MPTMLSERVSIQWSGRPSWRASQPISTSSRELPFLAPKAPPTSPTTTRTRSGSRPSAPARLARSRWGAWVDAQKVSRPSSLQAAAAQRGSIGQAARRGWAMDSSTTTSQSSNSPGSSPASSRMQVFVPASGKSRTWSVAASHGETTASSGS